MRPAFTRESRRENLHRLGAGILDVLVIGGGINGAGIARDLSLRADKVGVPLKIGLVEQRHFASGTSGRNSQLIHGGLRYLKKLEVCLVRESLRERAILAEMAPHLVKPLPFIMPMYGHFQKLYYGAGLRLYDWLAGDRGISPHRTLSAGDAARLEPMLESAGLKAAAVFYDALVHSARFVLENVFDAARQGVAIANYCRFESFEPSTDGTYGVRLHDMMAGVEFFARTRKLVDARGPWATGRLRLVRGSHLVLPKLGVSEHAVAHFEENGRIIFVIPWGSRNDVSLVGTTDEDHAASPDDACVSAAEAKYLLRIVRRLFPAARHLRPISAYSSLRPLVYEEGASPSSTSREHRIWNSEEGILRVAGGKYTTYRLMSAEAGDSVAAEVAPALVGRCVTASTPLGGNTREALEELETRYKTCPREIRRAVQDYGVLVEDLLNYEHEHGSLASAQIRFAVEHEMAQRLADLLFVSTYWGYERAWTPESLRPLAQEFGNFLGWDRDRVGEEIRLALRICALPEAC